MASETFKKRQKEASRREKQLRKVARRIEKRNEKVRSEVEGDPTMIASLLIRGGPTIL